MTSITVKPVESRREKKQFIQLAQEIYAGDEMWCPPLLMDLKERAGFSKHPFHDINETQTFIAIRDGKVVGRIQAIVNQGHIERFDERLGFFGLFESINDQEVADALFDTVRDWLADREIHHMRGPVNPGMNYEVGLLIDGWHSPPCFMMTYNPNYYARLFEDYGLSKVEDMVAFYAPTDIVDRLDPKMFRVVDIAKEKFNLKLRTLDKKRFKEDVRTFLDIYNKSLVGTWGFVPMSDAELEHIAKGLKFLIVPELTTFIEADGKVIGASVVLLDYNEVIKEIGGKLFPFGYKLFTKRKKITKMRLISANVLPEYQKWGLGVVLVSRLKDLWNTWTVDHLEVSWVLESNHLSYKSLARAGCAVDKTYRIYDKVFEETSSEV